MRLEPLQDLLHAAPFRPFSVHLADGKSFVVKHPDFVLLSQGGHTMVLNTDGEHFAWIEVRNVLRFEADSPELA